MASAPDYRKAQLSPSVHVAYIDSWSSLPAQEVARRQSAGASGGYSTIIGVHGVGYNSSIWTPLIPHLPTSTRLIAYNQRSYTGSSPAFASQQEGGTDATAAYLGDLLAFLRFCISDLNVPGVSDIDGSGGVSLLCWSKGTLLALSLLSLLHYSPPSLTNFLPHLPPSIEDDLPLLTSHLRSIILFEPPGSALGRPPTQDYTRAMGDVSPQEEVKFAEAFAGWIGSSSLASSDSVPPSLPSALISSGWEPQNVAHGFSWRLSSNAEEVIQLARNALAPPLSPAVSVGLVYGATTNGYCFDAARAVGELWGVGPGVDLESTVSLLPSVGKEGEKEEQEKEKERSKTAIKRLEGVGSNHFSMVHQPREFLEAVQGLWEELV